MTMTKLPTHVAFDLLVVEQLHDIVPCEWSTPCKKTARWIISCSACSFTSTICNPHREFNDSRPSISCPECGLMVSKPYPWVAL